LGTNFDKELVVLDVDWVEADGLLDCLDGLVDLIRKCLASDVGHDGHVGVTDPSSQSLVIELASLLWGFCSGFVVSESIVLFCSFGCGVHEDD
jgi:hypothetical protein